MCKYSIESVLRICMSLEGYLSISGDFIRNILQNAERDGEWQERRRDERVLRWETYSFVIWKTVFDRHCSLPFLSLGVVSQHPSLDAQCVFEMNNFRLSHSFFKWRQCYLPLLYTNRHSTLFFLLHPSILFSHWWVCRKEWQRTRDSI